MRYLFAVLTCLTLCFYSTHVERAAHAQPAAQGLCMVLALDNSRSMLVSDPTGLRITAVRLWIALADIGDQIGLVRFSTQAVALTPTLVTVRDAEDAEVLLRMIRDEAPDGGTDIRAALETAAGLLERAACDARVIVLLSDGEADLPGGLPTGYDEQSLAIVRRLNAPVLGIALTPRGQSQLLARLSEATDPPGVIFPAEDANQILDAFISALARLKDRTVIGVGEQAAPGEAELPLNPSLAPYLERATFVVSKPESVQAALFGPQAGALTPGDPALDFAYTADPRFAVYAMDSPAPGRWGFMLQGHGAVQARVILRSRLRLMLHQPGVFAPLGHPLVISASLVEVDDGGNPITLIGEAAISARILRPDGSQAALDQLYDDGAHGDLVAGDGVYTNLYPNLDLTGRYQLILTGHKGVVPVSRVDTVTVIPFPRLVIDQPDCDAVVSLLPGQALPLRARLEGVDSPVLDVEWVEARITRLGGQPLNIVLEQSVQDAAGQVEIGASGRYQLDVAVQGARFRGVPYTAEYSCLFDVRLLTASSPYPTPSPPATLTPTALATAFPAGPVKQQAGGQMLYILLALASLPGVLIACTRFARPRPWGTLRFVQSPPGHSQPSVVQLSRIRRRLFAAGVTIGSSRSADIHLEGLSPCQAVIRAGRVTISQRVGRPPRMVSIRKLANRVENVGDSTVWVNHLAVPRGEQSVPLAPGMRVRIGGYEFEYQE